MHQLKRYFITPYISFLAIVCIVALSRLFAGQSANGINIGLLLAAAPCFGFFIWLLGFRPPRTHAHPIAITLASAAGVVMVMLSMQAQPQSSAAHNSSFWLAALSFVGWYLYLRWYSKLPDAQLSHLKVGQALPNFELTKLDGESIAASELHGKPHILLFYRGNWCPLCVGQIQEVAAQWRDLERRGAEVVLISPQSQKHTQEIAERFDAPMQFMQDKNNQAAKQLGIAAPGGLPLGMELFGYQADVVLPTIIITNSQGQIAYAHIADNYRVRPEPDLFLKVLDQMEPVNQT